jgi:spore germination cell wall hydrolase CwlJ-like protein
MAKQKFIRLTDLPEEEVNEFIIDFKIDGYEFVQKFKQPNGLWTLEVRKVSVSGADASQPSLGAATGPAAVASSEDVLTLARTIYGEAAGESSAGKEAVASVVMNRVRSSRYPNSAAEVCLQKSQFSCWNPDDPNFAKIKNLQPGTNPVFESCYEIAERAVKGLLHDATDGAMHYYADYIPEPSWVTNSPNAKLTAKIGHHLFYTGIA